MTMFEEDSKEFYDFFDRDDLFDKEGGRHTLFDHYSTEGEDCGNKIVSGYVAGRRLSSRKGDVLFIGPGWK